ncbi:AAA family ATPase [Bosea beijingensis]|uniref:AAA family ATPase n=1 Tax=Bosea beijingensis TaxID=3068632 RepID=UPI002741D883|nr:AAA family ATPase [Bosea sp. REN20]
MGMLIGGMVAQVIMAFILPFIPLLLLPLKWARPFIVAYLLFLLAQWLVGQFIVATYAICAIAWLVTLILVAHAYKLTSSGPLGAMLDRLPGSWKLRIMDILDIIADKEALEERLQQKPKAEIIDNVAIAKKIKSELIGQDRVVDDFTAQMRRAMSKEKRKLPVSVLFFAGPPGVGKTMAAELIAPALGRNFKAFAMSRFTTRENASTLFGIGKGYVGSDSWGQLPATLRDYPDSVILFDEVEKADKSIYDQFLTAFESGFLSEASTGKNVYVNRAIFVFTSNSKSDEIGDAALKYKDDRDQLRKVATNLLVEDGFRPEFLDRFDGIFSFAQLEGLDVARVAAHFIKKEVESHGLKIKAGKDGINTDILFDFIERSKKRGTGNRDMRRRIEEVIADGCIDAKQGGFSTVRIDLSDNRFIVEPVA